MMQCLESAQSALEEEARVKTSRGLDNCVDSEEGSRSLAHFFGCKRGKMEESLSIHEKENEVL